MDTIEELLHYGIKGQEWGVRRYQNEDGTLTEEGKKRYGQKYSMTDQELQRVINNSRTRNEYIRLQTKDTTKRRQDISELIKAASKSGSQITNLYTTKNIDSLKEQKEGLDSIANNRNVSDVERDVARENSKAIQNRINDYQSEKNIAEGISKASEQGAARAIAKGVTSAEFNRQKDEALRNISELDENQLRKLVNRMLLEEQYDKLVNPPKPSLLEKGREWFQSAGALAGLALTALNIGIAIKTIRKKDIKQSDDDDEFLEHYGVKGQRWGERRYQNADGSLTALGYQHYGINPYDSAADRKAKIDRIDALERKKSEDSRAYKESVYRQKQAAKFDRSVKQQQARDYAKESRDAFKRELKEQKQLAKIEAKESKREFKQEIKERKQMAEVNAQIKKEQRKATFKNVAKYAIGAAGLAAVSYAGYTAIKNWGLNKQHLRDMEKLREQGKQTLDLAKITSEGAIEKARFQGYKERETKYDIDKKAENDLIDARSKAKGEREIQQLKEKNRHEEELSKNGMKTNVETGKSSSKSENSKKEVESKRESPKKDKNVKLEIPSGPTQETSSKIDERSISKPKDKQVKEIEKVAAKPLFSDDYLSMPFDESWQFFKKAMSENTPFTVERTITNSGYSIVKNILEKQPYRIKK